MTLDERKRKILESIIKDYVETAEPVGSRAVVKKHDLKVSAATVRNEMADLEEMGYLEQPHTSAGRIPSQMGFRYYVDCLMEKENLDEQEFESLQNVLRENLQERDNLIEDIAHFLSQVTNYASFVILPTVKFNEFKNLQIIPVEKGKALLLVVTDMGMIMHRKIGIPESMEVEELQAVARAFTQIFGSKKLDKIRRGDLQQIRDALKQRRNVIDNALEAIDNLLKNSKNEKVMISGTLNILNEPEFKDLDKLKRILTVLDEDGPLKNIIPELVGDNVDIRIGRENQNEDINEMSLVFAGYKSFGEMGKIGVIGPVRMEYWKAAGTVESVRDFLEELFKQRF
ncbi:MAG: heat-inducible transcriptional repressor HrcA [Syntrophomonadaceae bacterium]|nr:heat-inducible transcriptional repressor HrcA [Syntrophomonadaceae bacterium]MDD3023032.1 heat-inducible transcriptional repressor HrcA [Syntrophomonadaceae bacterium]